jgi:hypothetical protein
MAVSRTQTTELALPLAEAFEKCLNAAEAVPRASLADSQQEAGVIALKVRMSFKSWGERITLQLREAGPSRTSVEVTSRSSVSLTLVDYGKNAKNVQLVVDWLAKLPSAAGAAT